jgi:hypothetical protein
MNAGIDVAGCTNACRHCGVGGKPPHASFFSLSEMRELTAEGWELCPFFEPSAHPEFPEIMGPDILRGEYLSTNGFGFARAEHPEAWFARLHEFGWRWLSLTVHGLQESHDWFVGRRGAYDDIVRTTKLARANGFNAHWNLMPFNRNLAEVPTLLEVSRELIGGYGWLELVNCTVSPRLWRYERLRPSLREVREQVPEWVLADVWKMLDGSPFEPEKLTEAYWLSEWERAADSGEGLERFDKPVQFMITRDRRFVADHPSEGTVLGRLEEGLEVLQQRAEELIAAIVPSGPPPEAEVFRQSDLLHGMASSVGRKARAHSVYAS